MPFLNLKEKMTRSWRSKVLRDKFIMITTPIIDIEQEKDSWKDF